MKLHGKYKRLTISAWSAVLCLAMLLACTIPAAATQTNKYPMPEFTDVQPGQWHYAAIEYVVTHGYFKGVSDTSFAPSEPMTRAMFVTVLGRVAGVPDRPDPTPAFSDVKANSYYSGYVSWASENGIVEGISATLFGAQQSVTREQVAVFLYRYAKHIGLDVRVGNTAFPTGSLDSEDISPWALKSVVWAVSNGIIHGSSTGLEAKSNATRAQVAQFIRNFSEYVARNTN